MQVEENFKKSETEVQVLQERIAKSEQLSRRKLIEELAKLQSLARVELDQRMRKEHQAMERLKNDVVLKEVCVLSNSRCLCCLCTRRWHLDFCVCCIPVFY